MKNLILPAILLGSTLAGSALTFLPVTDIATPNMLEGNSGGNPLTAVIEGAGVGFEIAEPHPRIGNVWYTDAPGGFPSNYFDANPGDEIIILDLGQDRNLYELSYWGYSNTNGNGMRDFEVRFATEAEGGAAGLGDEDFGNSITNTYLFNALIDQTIRQSFGFGEKITARYVEIKALTNYFDIVIGGDRLGIGEISFAEPTAVGTPDLVDPGPQSFDLESGSALSVPILNTGDTDLVISSISFTGPNASAFSATSAVPFEIGPFVDGPVGIDFDRTGLQGDIEATMVVTSNDPAQSPLEIALSGTLPPLGPNLVTGSPVALALAETGVQTFPIPISNLGGQTLTITGVTVSGSRANAVSVISFPSSLAVDAEGEIVIEIDPQRAGAGALDANLEVASNDRVEAVTLIEFEAGLPVEFHPILAAQSNTVDFFDLPNLIAGAGTGFETSYPHTAITGGGTTWVTDAPNGGAGDYFDNDQPDPVIIFDLGSDLPLGEINTWGYAAGNTNGAKDYTLRFATSAEGGAAGLGDENFGTSITYQPSFEADFSSTARDTEFFEQPVVARYVEMTITDNWRDLQGGLPGGDRVGLGEVAFPVFGGSLQPLLGIVSAAFQGDGSFAITFYSLPGVDYELDRSTNGQDWTRLGVSLEGSPEEISTILDPNPPTDSKVVLYRVVQP